MASIAAGGVQAKPKGLITREAKRDLSDYQYCAMKIDTDGYIDYADTSNGDIAIGVLQNAPDTAGEEAEVATEGTSLFKATESGITEGSLLGSDSNYRAAAVTADNAPYFAIAMEDPSADGDLIEAKLVGFSYIGSAG
jgi:hypothetical protein